jgi:excisionase family DNA binding protein
MADSPRTRAMASSAEVTEVKFTVAEVSRMLTVSKPTVYRMIHNGDLAAYRLRRTLLVPMSEVRRLLGEAYVEPVMDVTDTRALKR